MNASSFITFLTYMLRQNGKRFYKGLYVTFKETKSATMNIFRKIFFSKNGVCKSRIKLCFHNKSVHYS